MTYRPPSGAPVVAGKRMSSGFRRQALTWLTVVMAALLAASAAHAAPGAVSSKEAQARDVMAQIQGLDANLERAVDSYNLANEKLAGIESDLRENKLELRLAKSNLRHAQTMLNARARRAVHVGRGPEHRPRGAARRDLDGRPDLPDRHDEPRLRPEHRRAQAGQDLPGQGQRAARPPADGSRGAGEARRAALGGEGFDRGPAGLAPAAPVLDQERDRADAGRGEAASGRARCAGTGAARDPTASRS